MELTTVEKRVVLAHRKLKELSEHVLANKDVKDYDPRKEHSDLVTEIECLLKDLSDEEIEQAEKALREKLKEKEPCETKPVSG